MELGHICGLNYGIAKAVGVDAALVFEELRFWATKNKSGWVYKTYTDMQERLPLSEYQLRKAYKTLEEAGFLEMKLRKANGFPTLHFRILKNFRMDTEKTSETMDTEKTSETLTANTHSNNTVWFQELNAVLGGSARTLATKARLKKLEARLKQFEYSDLAKAAFNLSKNDFMMGKNDGHVRYGDIDYLLRNDENVDKWLERTAVPKKRMIYVDDVLMESPF